MAVGVALAWFLVGKREVPREAPQDVSFVDQGRARRPLRRRDQRRPRGRARQATWSTGCSPSTGTASTACFTGGAGRRRRARPVAAAAAERLRPLLRPVRARRRAARRPGPPGGEPRMNDFPWLTVLIVVPLRRRAGRRVPAAPRPRCPSRSALAVRRRSPWSSASSIAAPVRHRRRHAARRRRTPGSRPFGVHYALGVDGLGLLMILLTVALVPIVFVAGRGTTDDDRDARARSSPGRWRSRRSRSAVFCRHRRVPLLRRLRGHADPGVLPDRRLRPRGPRRGGAEVPDVPARRRPGAARLGDRALRRLRRRRASRRTSSPTCSSSTSSTDAGRWLFVGFFIAFAVKAPLFPLHTWLADTTEKATPGTSVLLVCVLDKIGTFGMLRFCLGHLPGGLASGRRRSWSRWR